MGSVSAGFADNDYDYLVDLLVDLGFGDVELVSDETLSQFSQAWWAAAENLLTKARRWFAAGDDDRARRLVDRAVALPYDPHEDAAPAALAATTLLFDIVVDEMEAAETTDTRWLDAALAVLDGADEQGRFELRDVLVAVRDDYRLPKRENRRIFEATSGIPARTELRDMGLLPPEQLGLIVESIMRASIAYGEAITASHDGSHERS